MSEPLRRFGQGEDPSKKGHGKLPSEGTDRPRAGRQRRIWGRVLAGVAVLALAGVATWGFRALEKQAPSVDRSTLWIGAVQRGEFVRDVRASGTLMPKEIRWVPAPGDGRVEKLVVKPGAQVEADTVLIELSNPQLEKERLDAEWAVTGAEAQLKNTEADLNTLILGQESALSNMRSEHEVAKLSSERDTKMHAAGLIADFEVKVSVAKEKELATRAALAEKSLASARSGMQASLATQQAKVEQARALLALRNREWAALKVTAGVAGTVQQVLVEAGQQVANATPLAKVAQAGELKAELNVQETQVSDVVIGQPVRVDTRNGIALGHVSRIDPAVERGSVKVEVLFDETLPKGSRPDLSVEGTIELQRIADTLFVERPVSVNPNATLPMFHVGKDGVAVKAPVHFGSASSTKIEVLQGLSAGDELILSATTTWDQVDTLRLR